MKAAGSSTQPVAALSKLKNNIAKDISTPDHNNINLQSRTEWVYDCFCFEIHIIRIEGSFEDGATKRVVRWKPSMGRASLFCPGGRDMKFHSFLRPKPSLPRHISHRSLSVRAFLTPKI